MTNIGTYATITFTDVLPDGTDSGLNTGGGAWSAELTNISLSGISREVIDITSMVDAINTGVRSFKPGALHNPGEISIEGNLDPSVNVTGFNPVPNDTVVADMERKSQFITITLIDTGAPIPATNPPFPGAGHQKWKAKGFLTSYELGIPLEDKQTFSATIQLTSSITITESVIGV